jgi:hypothetical protein
VSSHEPRSASDDWTHAVGLRVMAEHGEASCDSRPRAHEAQGSELLGLSSGRRSSRRRLLRFANGRALAYFVGLNIGRFASVAT